MQHRPLGSTGIKVSEIIFGAGVGSAELQHIDEALQAAAMGPLPPARKRAGSGI
jgi:aryl-alcohol dehydrogenase-like predicted oxidoreductase